jgi:hypothetical protein
MLVLHSSIIHYIDTDRIIAIVHMLPLIKNPDALPYQCRYNTKGFFMKNMPDCLIPKKKFSANEKLSCYVETG